MVKAINVKVKKTAAVRNLAPVDLPQGRTQHRQLSDFIASPKPKYFNLAATTIYNIPASRAQMLSIRPIFGNNEAEPKWLDLIRPFKPYFVHIRNL